MFENWQSNLEAYLSYFAEYKLAQALIIFAFTCVLAWLLDHIIIGFVRRLTKKTSVSFDDQLLDFLHHPLHTSIILIGLASATLVLELGDVLEPIIFTVFKMLALLVWTRFVMRLTNYVLNSVAKNQQTAMWLHPQTLP